MALADDIVASMATVAPQRRATWIELLPPDAQAELLDIRKRWHAGEYTLPRLTLSRLVVKAAKDRGWKTCDEKRMAEWLKQND